MKLRAAVLLALAGAGTIPSADAAIFCVGTTNELSSALTTARGNGADDTIKVRVGSIPSPVGGFLYEVLPSDVNRSLDLSGGWNANCTTQTLNSTLTQLTGGDARRILYINRSSGTQGELRIHHLQFRNAFSNAAPDLLANYGVALSVFANQHVGDTAIEYCIFNANSTVNPLGSIYVLHKGSLSFRNNLVTGNLAGNGTAGVIIESLTNSTATISSNTITANNAFSSPSLGLGMTLATAANAVQVLTNNIIWGNNGGNTPYDIDADTGTTLISNDYAGLFAPAGLIMAGNVNLDPKFVGGGNYRLAGNSGARDVGNNTPFGGLPPTDLDGSSRVRGGTVDLGAYEAVPESIFKAGFE